MRDSGERPQVLVVGGAVAGLAAADRLADWADVTLSERQSYDDKRVNCGEAINDATVVPLRPTSENGFHNDLDAFDVQVFPDYRDPDEEPMARAALPCPDGYIADRAVVERRWADRLRDRGVTVRENDHLTGPEFREALREYDYVIDATGQPSLTSRTFDRVSYTGETVALNALVEGDFADYRARPRIVFEGYTGYAWSFPKTDRRANVGIGWAGDDRPDDYFAALAAACERNGFPVPDRSRTQVYTIPRGPSLDPADAYRGDHGLLLVGDAAGIANRYQGEGIVQAIRSAHVAAAAIREGRPETYPDRLYELMRSEYRLAHLMRGAWVESEDPALLAALTRAIDGATVETVTRRPLRVVARLCRHPTLVARLLADGGVRRRLLDAYTDRWEYTDTPETRASDTRGSETRASDTRGSDRGASDNSASGDHPTDRTGTEAEGSEASPDSGPTDPASAHD